MKIDQQEKVMVKSKKSLMFLAASSGICAILFLAPPVYSQTAKAGSLDISNAYTRATAPGQQVAGGFMKIENKASAADQLVSASSPAAGEVQLHEMSMEGNVMKMRQIKDIAVPAGGVVELKPGGLHLMLMNIKAPLNAGETIPVKLKFAKAGEVEVKMPVNAMGGAMKH
jgi:copper(I)-binding protein